MRAIVYQQLSGRAAGTIYHRLLEALGNGNAPGASAIAAADDDRLRGAGLSANKVAGVKALAVAQLAGELPDEHRLHTYDDAELIACYSAIRGIGRWTMEMLLLFHLGRPNVMPIHDLGVRKGYALPTTLTNYPGRNNWEPPARRGAPIAWWAAGIRGALEADTGTPQLG